MGENERIVEALLAAVEVKVEGRIHGASRLLKPHFRLIASVVCGIHRQCIGRIVKSRPTRPVDIKMPATAAPGQEVRAAVGEVRDIAIGLVDSEGDDAVGQYNRSPIIGHRDIGPGTSATPWNIGIGGNNHYP